MTHTVENKIHVFNCDGPECHKNYEPSDDSLCAVSFLNAWAEAKTDGWVNSFDGRTWQHFCPECKKKLGD